MVGRWRLRAGATGWRIDPCVALIILWSLFIVYGTMLPFNFSTDTAEAARRIRASGGAFGRPVSVTDVVSNVLLFMPLGLLLSFRMNGRATRPGPGLTAARATLCGLALSTFVECCQLFLPSRTPSLVDLATNSVGAAIGAMAGWALIRRARPMFWPALRRFVGQRPMALCVLAAGFGLVVAGLAPFDVSLDVDDLKSAVKRARPIAFGPPLRGPTPPAAPWSWAEESLTWALAGGLVALALAESGRYGPGVVATTIILCAGLSLIIEALQVLIPSRTADMTSVVFALIGSAAGSIAVVRFPRPDARLWAGPGLLVWGLVVLMSAWTPPHLAMPGTRSIHWSQLVPFWSYYVNTNIYALSDIFLQVLGFVPLGALLAARDPRRPVRLALLIGLGLGLVLEAGQLVLADRTAEITDALSAGFGASIGAWLWRAGASIRAGAEGYRRYRVR